jgi:protein phosphatase
VRRLLLLLALLGVIWMAGAAAWSWTQHQYYVGEHDGVVTIFRGVQADLPGIELSHPYQTTNVRVDELDAFTAGSVRGGIGAGSLDEAERTVQRLAANRVPTGSAGGG